MYICHETLLCIWATDAQGSEISCSETQNPLNVKMRAKTFWFCILSSMPWNFLSYGWIVVDFPIARDMWGGRDEYICGQKIYVLQIELMSKMWRQLRRHERPRNSEFVNWCVLKCSINGYWSPTTSRCLSVNPIPYLPYYLLTKCSLCAFTCNLYNQNYRQIFRFICVIRLPYILLKMSYSTKRKKNYIFIFSNSSHKI